MKMGDRDDHKRISMDLIAKDSRDPGEDAGPARLMFLHSASPATCDKGARPSPIDVTRSNVDPAVGESRPTSQCLPSKKVKTWPYSSSWPRSAPSGKESSNDGIRRRLSAHL